MIVPSSADLKKFYRTSPGKLAQRFLRSFLKKFWQNAENKHVAAIGFALPYVQFVYKKFRTFTWILPARQGPFQPETEGFLTLVAHEDVLPFADQTFEVIFIIHALENADSISSFLREVWRCLKPQGQVLIVVPNRLGVWSHFDHTPFGQGHAFSLSQLKQTLANHCFREITIESTLFSLPFKTSFLFSFSQVLARVLKKLFPRCGGVLVATATKSVFIQPPKIPITVQEKAASIRST